MSRKYVLGTVGPFTLPPTGLPMRWDNDLRTILAGELDMARYREKTEPYYRGETHVRPNFLDHDDESDSSTDVDSDSETMAVDSNDEDDGYVEDDAPVHSRPRPRWSSDFMDDFSILGLPRVKRTPSPPPLPQSKPLTHVYTAPELDYHGFESVLEWEGPTPLADRKNRLVGVLVDGPPQKADWNRVLASATAAIDKAKSHIDYDCLGLRGNTPSSLRTGIEYFGCGPNSARAQNVRYESLHNLVELAALRSTEAFQHISTWQNTIHYQFAPRLHCHIQTTKDKLLHQNPFLRDNFVGGAFPASEIFLGNPESPPRLDDLDMPWGWRALTSLGTYDPRWSAKLILWDEKKVIKFPPGATFLFPAAFIRYSFTPVHAGETHYAFSQYAQAGLFRYVENGFMSEANFEATAWKKQREARDRARDARMVDALKRCTGVQPCNQRIGGTNERSEYNSTKHSINPKYQSTH
ncbi:hypothetical protein C8F04DRAFT_1182327 [Mycena alexandri]|uniref:Uncharacterized protein n=1 Tax=Mycena alexandri TaxID=1745969 RepID=A0AAD6SZZ8_9AGAR|nr:hypothetical protein C8F04DRAFT_1182327 [Mycena alexandri]